MVHPLPLQEIKAWLDLNAFKDIEDRLDMVYYIKQMDLAYLEWYKEYIKSKFPKEDKKPKTNLKSRLRV